MSADLEAAVAADDQPGIKIALTALIARPGGAGALIAWLKRATKADVDRFYRNIQLVVYTRTDGKNGLRVRDRIAT